MWSGCRVLKVTTPMLCSGCRASSCRISATTASKAIGVRADSGPPITSPGRRPLAISIGDLVDEPAVVGLAGQLQNPVCRRHGRPNRGILGGQLADEAGYIIFPGRWPARDRKPRRSTSFSCSSSGLRRRRSRISADWSLVKPGFVPSSTSDALSQPDQT